MSGLLDYQRAFVRMSFALEPSETDLTLLGDPARFRMYRAMVRNRLEGMAKQAFARTLEAVGNAAFSACFARFLASVPPHSPLIREVVLAFGEFALGDAELARASRPHGRDMLRFELSKWQLAYSALEQPSVGERGVRDFDFEGEPVFNPLFRSFAFSYRVHEAEPNEARTLLFMYRPRDADQVRWYVADEFFFALVEHCIERPEPFAQAVRRLADAHGLTIDETFVERLSSSVALAIERGVLVGSR
jgi:hypothetical protein